MATFPGSVTTGTPVRQPFEAVHTEQLVRRFGDRVVLDHLELRIGAGEFVALLGRSGSGKSTLLRALAGLDHAAEGSGTIVAPSNVSVIFQDSRLLPWAKVLENVVLGLAGPDPEGRGRAALAEVGLEQRAGSWPQDLSGGEQQRVALARSLVRSPDLLLADEPFGALDALTRLKMHALMRDLHTRHQPAVLLVTHDVDEAIALAHRVVVLEAGRFVADERIDLPDELRRNSPEAARYRSRLLAALGVHDTTDVHSSTPAAPTTSLGRI